MSLCGSQDNTSTSTATSGPPAAFQSAYDTLLNQAGTLATQPLQQYSGDIVAGLSPDQTAAIDTIQDSQGIADPYLNASADYLSAATTPITSAAPGIASDTATQANGAATQAGASAQGQAGMAGMMADRAASTNVWNGLAPVTSQIQQYETPYTNNVVNATQAEFNNQNAQQNQGIIGNSISQGAWGGDRAGVAQGIAAGQEALAQAPVIAGLENQGYTQALGEANTEQSLQASLGQTQAGLEASTALSAGQLGANTALGAGNLATTTALGAGNLGISAAGQQMSADQATAWLNSQAAAGMANLGSEAQATDLAGANAQLSAGNLEQNQEQEELNVPYEQFLQQQAYPYQALQFASGIDTGVGSASGGTSTTTGTTPGPGLFQQLLGPASILGGAAILAGKRGGGIEAIARHGDRPGRASGGGIDSGVPDVSISFIPQAGIAAGGGPPKPPSLGAGQNAESNSSGGIGDLLGMSKLASQFGGSSSGLSGGMTPEDTNFGAEEAFDATGGWEGDVADMMMASGGGIATMMRPRRAAGGSGGHVTVPHLSLSRPAPQGVAANLTKNYGNAAADSLGNSTLPSTTYYPNMAPWAAEKPVAPVAPGSGTAATPIIPGIPAFDPNSIGGLPTNSTENQFRRGGTIRRDDGGGISDDDMDDASNDNEVSGLSEADDGAGIGSSPAAAPFETHPIEEQPDGAALAPPDMSEGNIGTGGAPGGIDSAPSGAGRYQTTYQPRQAQAQDPVANRRQALGLALLTGGAGMMASRSPHGLEALGQGISQGVSTYMGVKGQQQAQAEKQAEQADTGSYRAATLDQQAQKFSDDLAARKDQIKATGEHVAKGDALAQQKADEQARHDKAMEGNQGDWDYLGPSPDDPTKGVYMNKKNNQTKTGPAVAAKPVSSNGLASPEAIDFGARQLLAGDPSPLTSMGMGAAGTQNKVALRNRMTELAVDQGISPEDLAAKNAEYFGTKAGERTLSTRTANIEMAVNEASNMGVLARQASANAPRGKWMPINTVVGWAKTNSGDPAWRPFGAAVNSYLNAYATAVGKGTMTVDARNHAEKMLGTADGPKAFNAVMDQLDKEMQAAKAAPAQVRKGMHDAVTGQDGGGGNAARSGPSVGTVEGGHRFKGGDPANPSSWEPVQ